MSNCCCRSDVGQFIPFTSQLWIAVFELPLQIELLIILFVDLSQQLSARLEKLLHLFTGYKTCYIMCSLWNHRLFNRKNFFNIDFRRLCQGLCFFFIFCFIFTLSLANYPRRQLSCCVIFQPQRVSHFI